MVDLNEWKPVISFMINIVIASALVLLLINPSTVLEVIGTITIIGAVSLIVIKTHLLINRTLGGFGLSKEINLNEKYIKITYNSKMIWFDFSDRFIHIYRVDDSKFMKQDDNGDFITYKIIGDGKDYAEYKYVSSIKEI